MQKLIHRLRQKPEEQKKQIIMVALLVSMSFVVLVWLSSIGVKEEKQKKIEEDTGPSPFSMLIESFSETFKDIKNSIYEADLDEIQKGVSGSEDDNNLENEEPDMDYIEQNLSQ